MTQKNIATIQQVSKKFADKFALSQVSLEIKAGEVLSILGPNGAGKTTLINLMLGRLALTEGEIKLLGNRYHFNDKYRVESFISTIHTRNQLRINVKFYSDSKLLYSECWTPNGVGGNFYQIDGNTFTIKNANASEKHFLEIKYNIKSQLFNVINTANKIDVSVQSNEYCNRNKLAVN